MDLTTSDVARLSMLLACLVVSTAACDGSDRFDDAPSARASELSAEARSPSNASNEEGSDLPQGHPPVGEMQQDPSSAEGSSSGSARPPGEPPSPKGNSAGRGGAGLPVQWNVPEAWTSVEPASRMRKAQYRLPGPEDANPATMAVYYFGARGGGTPKANIDRWIGQFEPSGERTPREAADISKETIGGMTVHRVDIQGRFNPGRGMGAGKAKDGRRLRGVIAESSKGMVFFKLVGPAETVKTHDEAFEQFVSSLKPRS